MVTRKGEKTSRTLSKQCVRTEKDDDHDQRGQEASADNGTGRVIEDLDERYAGR